MQIAVHPVAAACARTAAAMGTTARVTVVGGASPLLADAALRRIHDLESRWSRFQPTSELSRLNAAAGTPCLVSDDTFLLVQRLVRAWFDTAGRFDPTVHQSMHALGYTDRLPTGTTRLDATALLASMVAPIGCADIRLDAATRMVWLPDGTRLDPGGLGKGLAADIVANETIAAGASGVLVDLGGDVRVIGCAPDGGAWRIGVEHPLDPEVEIAIVETTDGGIATSSRHKRRWHIDDGDAVREVHHVIDPTTRRSADTPWLTATVLAPDAASAEVGATVTFLDGTAITAPHVFAALLADEHGAHRVLGERPELFRYPTCAR